MNDKFIAMMGSWDEEVVKQANAFWSTQSMKNI